MNNGNFKMLIRNLRKKRHEKIEIQKSKYNFTNRKKAKKINLDDGFNVIIGDNDTGKSSLLKTLYYAFGTKPHMDTKWRNINPIPIIDFSYNGQQYIIIRHGSKIVTFNENKEVINYSQSITKEFTPFFSEFFNFNIKLQTSNTNVNQQATPAFCILPFYIDQDKSWNKYWNSFDNLGQFTRWQDSIVNYHTGLKTSEYFKLKSKRDKLKNQKKEKGENKKILESIYDNKIEKFEKLDLSIPLEEFKREIISLLNELNTEKIELDSYKNQLKNLYNDKYISEGQLKITKASINELNADYEYCTSDLDLEVECPICGACYNNSFEERFSIARDEESCLELSQELKEKIKRIENKIDKIKKSIFAREEKTSKIGQLLRTKKHELTLRDLIDYKGKQNFIEILQKELNELKIKIAELDSEINRINKEINRIESPERKRRI